MRKHGWFRPHVRGLTAISSTTLREGGGWWIPGSQLDLDFANDRSYNRLTGYNATPNGLLTYTSPSPKMVYGDDGVLRYARHNLLTYSEQFDNAAWVKVNVTVSGSTIQCGSGGTVHRISQVVAPTSVRSRVYYDIKAGTHPYAQILDGANSANYATFDLSTGTVGATGANTTASITALGDGFYRCQVEFGATNLPNNTTYLGFAATAAAGYASSFSAIGTETIIAARGQLQLLPCVSTTYIGPTTSAAKYSLPIDHDPVTHAPLGVLIEEQRTNLLLQSQTFATTWNPQRCSVSSDAAVGGDGTQTADAFVEDSASGAHQLYQTVTKAASSIQYALSVEIEPQNRTWCRLQASTGGEVNYAATWFNLSGSGSVGTPNAGGAGFTNNSSSITLLPNGRYKLVLVFTSDTGTSVTVGIKSAESDGSLAHVGNSLTAFYLWGAQLEAGAFATSYIQTGSAQVTRAADQISIANSSFNWSNATGTTRVAMTLGQQVETSTRSIVVNDSNGRIMYLTGPTVKCYDGTTAVSCATALQLNAERTIAQAYGGLTQAITVDGSVPDTGNFDGTMGAASSLYIGYGVGTQMQGHIKRLTYWNSRKPDAELQALSA